MTSHIFIFFSHWMPKIMLSPNDPSFFEPVLSPNAQPVGGRALHPYPLHIWLPPPGIKFQNFKRGGYFDILLIFFSHQGRDTKNPSAHISLTNIGLHVFRSPYSHFFSFPISQNLRIYYVWFLFGVTPVLIVFRAILKQLINNWKSTTNIILMKNL